MRVKDPDLKKKKNLVRFVVIGVLFLSVYILFGLKNSSWLEEERAPSFGLDEPTKIKGLNLNYQELLKGNQGKIYEDSNLKIYAVNKSGIAKVIYAYKHKPEGREITDNFFLHLYIKDSKKLTGSAQFVNVDFFQKAEPMQVDTKKYYVFHKDLKSSNYVDGAVPLSMVKHIRTGRNKPRGDRSLDLGKIPIIDIPSIELKSDQDALFIKAKAKDFDKIKKKRSEALDIGVLSSADGDLISGQIALNSAEFKDIDFRLKGDWPDHLQDKKKWSYRIIMKDGETFKGMRKFSIQHPKVRNYLWEWLLNKVVKDAGIIGLRYDYAEVILEINDKAESEKINLGLMAIEESFDKILIENNKKREGVIIAFDESVYWSDVKKQRKLKLDGNAYSKSLRDVMNAPIRVFNESNVLSDPTLSKQFETAKDLLDGLRKSKYTVSDVFDMDKLTTFVAINNLFAGSHGLVWHNLRIYYNPITGKLEPISFDSVSGRKLEKITHYPFAETDSIYQIQLREKLAMVSSLGYINDFLGRHKSELTALKAALFTEYSYLFDDSVLEYNSNFIKKHINPAMLITSSLVTYDDKTMDILVNNLSEFPVVIAGLLHKDKRKLSIGQSVKTIPADTSEIIRFVLNDYFVNAFISKKNKKGVFQYPKDISKLRIEHFVSGVKAVGYSEISPYSVSLDLDERIALHKKLNTPNIDEFAFIERVHDSLLVFKNGSYVLSKNLIIPEGYIVEVTPGFSLDIKNMASIRSKATLLCKGTKEKPITFYSSDGTGQGIFITNARSKSQIAYTTFDNLSNPQSNNWSVSGAVNFHVSDVSLSHVTFKNNRCEDALNIISSSFSLTESTFTGTQSDSFDGDFVHGIIKNCTFINSGNDSIDVSGSQLAIHNITITNPSDKGISAGEKSTITGKNVHITGGEIGVVSKDLSKVTLTDLSITGTRLGLSAFQKKSEYGVASIAINSLTLADVALEHLIEVRSSLMIDNHAVKTVSNNVIDQMYGKEYGKSSK